MAEFLLPSKWMRGASSRFKTVFSAGAGRKSWSLTEPHPPFAADVLKCLHLLWTYLIKAQVTLGQTSQALWIVQMTPFRLKNTNGLLFDLDGAIEVDQFPFKILHLIFD
jgi:hypothetical protein